MQHLDARIASFKPVLRPKSRAKPAFPLSPSEYPLLTPQNLAEAGFYHLADQPDLSYPDSCKCFTCGLHLGGWDADDNPHAEHWKRDNGCVWAQAVCLPKVEKRLRATNPLHRTAFFTEDSLPGSSKSAAMREATFGKWWPHKARSGIPTPKEMAQAGFLYYGSTDSQDCVLCPWCEYSADGWEAGDDPLEIHRSKSADCRFFTTVVEGTQEQAAESTSKTSRSTKPQTSNRSKRHTTAQVIPPESQDELASEAEVAEEERPASPEKPKRGTKARATTVKAKGGRGRKMAETVESEMDVTEDETQTLETRSVAPVEEGEEGESQAPSTKSNGKPRKPRGTKASTKKGAADAVDVVPITTDSMSAPLPSTQVPGSVDAGTSGPSSQSSRPAGKPKSKPSKSTRPSTATSSKPAAASRQADDGEGEGEREEESTPRPLSQLDRFTNIPPSSPMPPPPTLKASRSSKQPTKKTAPSDQTIPIKTTTTSGPTRTPGPTTTPAPATTTTATTSTTARSNTLSRDVLNATLDNAAIRAAHIINLPGTQPGPGTGAGGRGGVDAPAELESSSSSSAAAAAEAGVQRRLSEEEMKMTLEEMVRYEYKRQYDEMKRQGEEMIRVWEQRAKEGRKRIQAI